MRERKRLLEQLKNQEKWDVLIIGGGASGLGCVLDAISRGYSSVLFEKSDFAKGTSSRSTKLLHGGVRYLAQGNVSMVYEALEERGLLATNAKHLFKNKTFIVPNYNRWYGYFYAIGLKLYDLLSLRLSLGASKLLSSDTVVELFPNIKNKFLVSGVSYQDGQFDDARLALNLAQTAIKKNACLLNYFEVKEFLKKDGYIDGVIVADKETGVRHKVYAKMVINATGVASDRLMQLDNSLMKKMILPSQGVHLVVSSEFLKGDIALLIPKTKDGRVLFIIPWMNKVMLGTTDTKVYEVEDEPKAKEEEISFILETVADYLEKPPKRSDVLSVYAGLRPLVKENGNEKSSKEVSREHKIISSSSGLISIIGGKWTTYRKIGEEVVDFASALHGLPMRKSETMHSIVHGAAISPSFDFNDPLFFYGEDLMPLRRLMDSEAKMSVRLHDQYPFVVAQVYWAIRNEMARTVEDVLARRIRLLFLDAQAAIDVAPKVAAVLASELQMDSSWEKEQLNSFVALAQHYLLK